MDTVTPAKRSYVMSRVKGRDTSPERIVRRLVYHAGYRYRLCDPRLPGKPDLVFWGKHKVIFVHGCFWHGHEGCRRNRMPKSNQEYWFAKLEKKQSQRFSAFIKTTPNGLAGIGSLGVRT